MLTDHQKQILENYGNGVQRHNVLKDPEWVRRWPKHGNNILVPFTIVGEFTHEELKEIDKAIKEYHRKTCIRFVDRERLRTKPRDFLRIRNDGGEGWRKKDGCWANLGKIGGGQDLNLQRGDHCFKGTGGT